MMAADYGSAPRVSEHPLQEGFAPCGTGESADEERVERGRREGLRVRGMAQEWPA